MPGRPRVRSIMGRPYPWPVKDRLLRALRREPVDRTPVWFRRQAGRCLPEYRELRGDRDILEAVREPDLAVEVTLQPLRRMPVDAAIVFSDIIVPLAGRGAPLPLPPGCSAGAPFTLASYLVEGGPSRDHARTKALMHGEPSTWSALMDALVAIVRPHLLR